jgi:hypothetical protein
VNVLKLLFVTLLAGGVLLLASCQGAGSRTGYYSSPLQPGDELIMLKTLTIPSGKARIYLQGGKTGSYGGSNQYEPFCYFLVRDPLPAKQQIKPGTFVVDSVWLDETTVSVEYPVRLAAAYSVGSGGGRSPIAYQFHIALKAVDQQDVTLVCSGAYDMPVTAAPIRLPEVRQALGDYAEVRVKTVAPP